MTERQERMAPYFDALMGRRDEYPNEEVRISDTAPRKCWRFAPVLAAVASVLLAAGFLAALGMACELTMCGQAAFR